MFAKGEELGCRDCVTHDRGHGRRAALSAPSADCEAAPRCTCCNNVPRLIHRRLSASSDSYDGRLCKTSRVHARGVCVCVCKHTRESASGAEKAERSWEYFLERIAGTRRIRNLVAKRGEAGTTTSLWEIRSGGRLMELFTVRLIILAIASGSSSLVIGGMGLRGKGRKCV